METVTDLSQMAQSSVDLSKAIADFGALAVIGGVFMVFILLILSLFVYQLFTQQKKLTAIAEFSETAMKYFEEMAMRNVNLDQARGLISLELERSKDETIIQVVKIKQKNHLDDIDAVQDKINSFLDRLYSGGVSMLRKFDFQGKNLSTFMESHWKEIVKKQMLRDCTNHEIDIHRLEESYTILFMSFKTNFNSKIDGQV